MGYLTKPKLEESQYWFLGFMGSEFWRGYMSFLSIGALVHLRGTACLLKGAGAHILRIARLVPTLYAAWYQIPKRPIGIVLTLATR